MSKRHVALRDGRVSERGRIYLVTFTTRNRRALFADFAAGCVAALAILDACAGCDATLLAWVLMPDHWQCMLQLESTSLSDCVRRMKGTSARGIRSELAGIGAIWSPAFHDRALRCEDDLVAAARYVVLDPVRAGLVQRVGDYPFWNAVWVGSGVGGSRD